MENRDRPRWRRRIPVAAAATCTLLLAGTSAWGAPDAARAMGPAPGHAVNKTIGGASTTAKSHNWAGYAVWGKGVTFHNVVGSWVQPAASCPSSALLGASFWVGIDGFLKNSKTVEQIGTDSDCSGGPTYYAWWEMYPGPVNRIPQSVLPGDNMTADVSSAGSTFSLTLSDNSQGWSFTTTQSASVPESSAEWIAESPLGCNGCSSGKLADFGSVTFSGLAVTYACSKKCGTGNPPFNNVQIQMYKGKTVLASTGLEMNGSSFTVTWCPTCASSARKR
ncbi:MAG TPA: G1 family glutamic endopeptidase [Acidimicrobiales bacterium]